ncbi:MAG: T9SS type A sorting domain-containing protein [Bacteroidota bacterium]
MKRYLFLVPFYFLSFLQSEKCIASQIAGAEITYTCTGGNNYRFYFTLYSECGGQGADTSYTISGASSCGDSAKVIVSRDSTVEIMHTCSLISSKCINAASSYIGIEANYFHGDVTIPSACNFWTFGMSPPICSRNGATNLEPNGSAYCLYVKATVNNSVPIINSSPVFQRVPGIFLGVGNTQYVSQYAFDPDGDSLTFELIKAHSNELNDVQYKFGLSATQPVYYTIPDSTSCNPRSGQLRFIANVPQTAVVAMQINEFRNDVLIGSVERDVEYVFANNINNPPSLSGVNGQISFNWHICADSLLTFLIKSSDIDAQDQTSISWLSEIPSAIFNNSGTHRDTGHITWQPSLLDFRSRPYFIIATVTDSACPVPGINSYCYSIYVDSCTSHDGITENEMNEIHFSAFYNSSGQSIRFYYHLNEPSVSTISLYDLTGRKMKIVMIEKLRESDGVIDVSSVSSGMYVLNLKIGNAFSKSIKVVID